MGTNRQLGRSAQPVQLHALRGGFWAGACKASSIPWSGWYGGHTASTWHDHPLKCSNGTGASEQAPGKCQGVQWHAWTKGSAIKVLNGDQQQSWAVLLWMQCVVQVLGTLVAGFSQLCAAGRQQPPVAWHLPSMVLQSLSDPSPSAALLASLQSPIPAVHTPPLQA